MTWKVLLLDFNARSAAELRPALVEAGCDLEVITDRRALGAATTLAQLSTRQCDAVLLSVALPRLAGVGLLDRIHHDTRSRNIPVIIVGSDATLLTWHETKRTPAEGYLRRSPDLSALVGDVSGLLHSVVGAGRRTMPPPPPGSIRQAAPSEATSTREPVGEAPKPTRTQPRLRLVPPGGGVRVRRSSRPSLEEVSAPSAVGPDVPVEADPAARIRHLEAALEKSLDRLRDAGLRIEGQRSAHEEALSSMATELHAVSTKLGKKLSDVTARALAAEERSSAHASCAADLAAAHAALGAMRAERDASEQRCVDVESRLDREVAARKEDQQFAVAALRVAEEQIASLVAHASAVPSRRSMPAPDSQSVVSRAPSSSDLVDRRSSGPPPVKSGPRATMRPLASFEGDRDDSRPPGCRTILLIDADKAARVNTARALARASWEVTVRDTCAEVADMIGSCDIIVTEVVGVAIEELLRAFREDRRGAAIVVWTLAVDRAREMFGEAGTPRVTVLEKAYRTDDLVAAVQAHLDETPSVAMG